MPYPAGAEAIKNDKSKGEDADIAVNEREGFKGEGASIAINDGK